MIHKHEQMSCGCEVAGCGNSATERFGSGIAPSADNKWCEKHFKELAKIVPLESVLEREDVQEYIEQERQKTWTYEEISRNPQIRQIVEYAIKMTRTMAGLAMKGIFSTLAKGEPVAVTSETLAQEMSDRKGDVSITLPQEMDQEWCNSLLEEAFTKPGGVCIPFEDLPFDTEKTIARALGLSIPPGPTKVQMSHMINDCLEGLLNQHAGKVNGNT